jgi:hypothetical protein
VIRLFVKTKRSFNCVLINDDEIDFKEGEGEGIKLVVGGLPRILEIE